MTDSLIESSATLTRRLVDLLWDQWSELGLAGYARSPSSPIVDPEALILLSTRIARHDSRLFDEILDWLLLNGSRINLQRLRYLMKEYPFADTSVLAAMAECLAGLSAQPKWKLLLGHLPAPRNSTAQPLFLPARFFGEPHPVFLKWGFLRGPLDLRGMSQPPRADRPATFIFKLRALFGNQARAEIIAWLLANDVGHPAEIARQTGHFRRTVQLVLNELAESGHARAVRIGREKSFSLRHEHWKFLMNWPVAGEFPRWVHWPAIFQATLRIREALEFPGMDEKSENFRAVQLRQALDDAMPALVRAGLSHTLRATRDLRGAALIDAVLADLKTLIEP